MNRPDVSTAVQPREGPFTDQLLILSQETGREHGVVSRKLLDICGASFALIQGATSAVCPQRHISESQRRSREKEAPPKWKAHFRPISVERFLNIPLRVCRRHRSTEIGSNLSLQMSSNLRLTTPGAFSGRPPSGGPSNPRARRR